MIRAHFPKLLAEAIGTAARRPLKLRTLLTLAERELRERRGSVIFWTFPIGWQNVRRR